MRGKKHDRIKTAGRIALCLVLALGLFGPAGARAQSDEAPVRVGYYENEVFQEGAEEGAVKTGYAYEYYRKLSEYTGWKYEYVYGGYGELYQMLLDGDIDLLAGLAFREERTAVLSYPDAIMGSEAYYLVKQDSETDITADPATLRGKVIGVLDSAMVGVLESWLDDHRIDATVVAYPDHPQLFGAFDSGELDVFVAEGVGSHVRPHAEVMYAFGSSDYYLCVNIRRPDLLDELNAAQIMLAAEEPNYLNSLSAKYYSLSVTARAFSSAEREWMDTHDALHVGYLENYLPYSDTDADGQVTGIVKDLVPEILSTLGISDISVTWAGYRSYDDMVADMASGEIDVAFPVGGGLYYSEENGIYQSNPGVSASTEIVFRGTYSEDTPAHFAVNENNRMQYYYVRTYFPDAEITLYPSIDECLAAVLDGKAGCTTLNGLRANDMLKNRRYKGLSLLLTDPGRAHPLLSAGYRAAKTSESPSAALAYAHVLGLLGDAAGASDLAAKLDSMEWDKGWNYRGMDQFGRSVSWADSYLIALGRSRGAAGFDAAMRKAKALVPDHAYSHFRAVALAFEGLGDRRAAPVLKELLSMPGVGGHSLTAETGPSARIPKYDRFTTRNLGAADKERSLCLRELCLARALWRLGDSDGLAEKTLRAYMADPRRAYANHARLVLEGNGR